MANRKRLGLPKPDLSNPGQWIPISRAEEPAAFRNPQEQAEADARYAESEARLAAIQNAAATRHARRPRGNYAEGDVEETDGLVDEDESPAPLVTTHNAATARRARGPRVNYAEGNVDETDVSVDEDRGHIDEEEASASRGEDGSSDSGSENEEFDEEATQGVAASGDALDIWDEPWQVGQPKSQPLTYAVPTVDGGRRYRTIKFQVDFNNKDSVQKANKRRHLARGRANKKAGGELRRPSTKGREFTQENDAWILAEHDRFAATNSGNRISIPDLTARYNVRFPLEGRTESSLSSHIGRREDLKNRRASFSLD